MLFLCRVGEVGPATKTRFVKRQAKAPPKFDCVDENHDAAERRNVMQIMSILMKEITKRGCAAKTVRAVSVGK
jgi:hypothetical protein